MLQKLFFLCLQPFKDSTLKNSLSDNTCLNEVISVKNDTINDTTNDTTNDTSHKTSKYTKNDVSFQKTDSYDNVHETQIVRSISRAHMSNNENIFHNHLHVEQVASFMNMALGEFKFLDINDSRIGCIDTFRKIMICAAYMHDICHPANDMHMSRRSVEIIAGLDIKTNMNTSIRLARHVSYTLCDMKNPKLEFLHALIGLNLTDTSISLDVYQKQFLMCMILATDLDTYSDISNIDLATPSIRDVGKVLIRCSDMSHFTLKWTDHILWVHRLCTEMNTMISAKNQVEFIDKYVMPQFKVLHCLARSPVTFNWLTSVAALRQVWECFPY